MIAQFGKDTALLLIDVQQGVNVLSHWGGPTGRRNNPNADDKMRALLKGWRDRGLTVIYTRHDSREPDSPLKLSLPTGNMIDGFDAQDGEIVIEKNVNSAFIGTDLELRLRQAGCHRLVIAGYFTNFCVETSTRQAGNLGYDTYLADDACATCNHIGPDGADHDPELLHQISVANLHGEFCTALETETILTLLDADAPDLKRAQGNEETAAAPVARAV